MKTCHLGLIGKNIGHSRSPELYNELIKIPFRYALIDIQSKEGLPSIDHLGRHYYGVNITAPYKKFYLDSVKCLTPEVDAINTIKFVKDKPLAINSDWIALKDLLPEFIANHRVDHIILLGDGAMASMILKIIDDKGYRFTQLCRSLNGDLNHLNWKDIVSDHSLVLNACSRDFVFESTQKLKGIFWDMNYSFRPHERLRLNFDLYQDGYSLLKSQAKHSAIFWDLIP